MGDHPEREIQRALSLTNPFMDGPDVRELQDSEIRLLKRWGLSHPDPDSFIDGEFGKRSRRQSNRVLELLGADPTGEGPAGPVFTKAEQLIIRNPDSRTAEQKERSKRRVEAAQKAHQDNGGEDGIRQKIVAYCLWGCDHEPSIHYRQSRPYPSNPATLPMYTDCSGFATLAYKYAGAPDPNGLGFNGYGFTGTLIANMDHIPPSACKPGDLIIYGPASGHHVVIAITAGSNPMTVSHGQEAGPFKISHGDEDAYQPEPETFCRILDD